MRPGTLFASGAALALGALIGCGAREPATTTEALPQRANETTDAGRQTPPAAAERAFTVSLTGAEEVPGPGDEDGRGTARITLREDSNQVCYELSVQSIEAATAAHIHTGVAGQAGGVAVMLDAPAQGTSQGCVSVEPTLLQEIGRNPANYYVNVHNGAFPQGAMRGQLGR